jgi:choline dehydrogenase-like flavoprotein
LLSADPLAAPVINPGFLSDPTDLVPLDAGVRLAREIADAKPLAKFRGSPPVSSPSDPVAHIRAFACAMGYGGGTCKMGDDPDSVVDFNLQVRGVAGLRVADASVIPAASASGNTFYSILIAEKAGRLISG